MRANPSFTLRDPESVKELIRANPWARFISCVPGDGLVASHYPVLVDEQEDGIVLLSHVGRPDEVKHQLGQHPVMVIVEGPHGYISPGWYRPPSNIPTWNFVTAHLHGTPELLDAAENLRVLDRLVDHFESQLPEPRQLTATAESFELAQTIAAGTVGFRMVVERFEAKEKMSQNKSADTVRSIIGHLQGSGAYANSALAERMAAINGPAQADTADDSKDSAL